LERLVEFAGKLCLALLAFCAVFQALFLGMAYAVERLTDPPACQVAYAFPMPFAVCPGFGLDATLEYLMTLPGAVLALPLLLPDLLSDASSVMRLYILIPLLVHVMAWGYLIVYLLERKPKRYR